MKFDNTQNITQGADTISQTDSARTAVVAYNEEKNESLFARLLHHTQDAHEIELPSVTIDLPYMIYDGGRFYYYCSTDKVLESGKFTVAHQKLSRADGSAPTLDLSLTKHLVFLWLAAIILVIAMIRVARLARKSAVPKGFANLTEVFVAFVRDEILLPNTGEEGLRYLPYLLTTFFFILMMNLLGLIPYGSTPTGNVNVTAGLAIIAFVMIQVASIRAQGFLHYLKHLTGGVHPALWPIMVPIEVLGLFTKPFALCIRLFANMMAGHIVIVSLFGLIFLFKSYIVAPGPIMFVLGISMLELFVAFLQAYIFTMLTALFMGLGVQAAHESHGEAEPGLEHGNNEHGH